MEEGTTDWNSRTEQRERPQRDRLFARDVLSSEFIRKDLFKNKDISIKRTNDFLFYCISDCFSD
jgi:hypothetical protein